MKNKKKSKLLIRPTSIEWLPEDSYCVATYFSGLGFTALQEILDLRVFDLLNMRGINAIRAEEIITCLYLFLNPNDVVDEAMYNGSLLQPFSYPAWRKIHKDLSKVTLKDLVMADQINLRAVQHFYDCIRKKFYHSDEYDWKMYRFESKSEYLSDVEKRRKDGK